ncbi:class I adenylate-forming enzyme family protein [soil metagenome]
MNHWHSYPVLPTRHESLYGDRIVRCFSPRPASAYALFANSVQRWPDAQAVVFEGHRWSYAQTQAQAEPIAAGLAAQGVGRGDRVAMLIDNRPEFVFVLLAIQRLGAVAVPIGVREQRPGVAYVLGQCGAKAIVFDAALAERVPDAAEAPSVSVRVVIGDANGATGDAIDAVALTSLTTTGADRPASPATDVDEQDAAVILYTSGTTGKPKGAVLTHLNVVHSALHYEACMGLKAGDRSALAVPASHVTGLIATIASMLYVGGTVVIVPAFKAATFIDLIAAERVTHTLMVPAMYNLCLLAPNFADRDLKSWRLGGYGGAPMPVATIDALTQRLPQLTLLNAYGATETTSPVTMMPAGETRGHADTVGVALPCADIRVMDDEGHELPAGESGELWIGGPMVVPRYWDNPQATATGFTAGYWHSGDLGSVDAQGYVRIFDRKKDMLNRGGFKIYSVEVENTLMALPGVVEAAIVGMPCPVLGERVHAFIYAPDAPHDDGAARQHCAAALADYKVPESITWTAAPLPRNANGKVMKRLLREQLPV